MVPPPHGCLKTIVDKATGHSGVAATIIQDYDGIFIDDKSKVLQGCIAEEVEAWSFSIGLQVAQEYVSQNIFIIKEIVFPLCNFLMSLKNILHGV